MPIWILLAIVCAAGAIGGAVNALLSDNGFLLPSEEDFTQSGGHSRLRRVIRPGCLGNVLTGAVAAGVSWGLYGASSGVSVVVAAPAGSITLSTLAGAVLVGLGGAKWLSNAVDKRVLQVAASKAAAAPANPEAAQELMVVSPREALRIVQGM